MVNNGTFGADNLQVCLVGHCLWMGMCPSVPQPGYTTGRIVCAPSGLKRFRMLPMPTFLSNMSGIFPGML